MTNDRSSLCRTLFISGWIVFLGSALFDALIAVNHTTVNWLSLNSLYNAITFLPYVGLLFLFVSAVLFIRDLRGWKQSERTGSSDHRRFCLKKQAPQGM